MREFEVKFKETLRNVLDIEGSQPLPPLRPPKEQQKKEVEPLAFDADNAPSMPDDSSRKVRPALDGAATTPPQNKGDKPKGILQGGNCGLTVVVLVGGSVAIQNLVLKKEPQPPVPTQTATAAIAPTKPPDPNLERQKQLWKQVLDAAEVALRNAWYPDKQLDSKMVSTSG
jgi:hypothetical protein